MTGFRDLPFGQSAVAPKSGIRRITDVRCTSEMCHFQTFEWITTGCALHARLVNLLREQNRALLSLARGCL